MNSAISSLASHTDMLTILKNIDQNFLKDAVSGDKFQEYFFANRGGPVQLDRFSVFLSALSAGF